MINKALLKQLFKSNMIIIALFTVILAFYQSVMIGMYTPQIIEQMQDMASTMGSIGSMGGMDSITGGYTGYVGKLYYAMIVPMFAMIYIIIIGNKNIAGRVDKGSMACILASPIKRNTVTITTAVFFILSLIGITVINGVVGLLVTAINKHAEIEISKFLLMNANSLIFLIGLSSISFFFSCLFNESGKSIAFGGGIQIIFFLFYMISDFSKELNVFKKITIFSLNMQDKIATADYTPVCISMGALVISSIILYIAGIKVFNKKDLPL